MYTKPQLIEVGRAVDTIRGGEPKGDCTLDGTPPHDQNATCNAYEADE